MIILKPVDLKGERVTNCHAFYIDIKDNHLIYRVHWICDQPDDDDEMLPWKEHNIDSKLYVRRDCIVASELRWSNINKCWKVVLSCNGMRDDLDIPFSIRSEAVKVFDQINEWIYGVHS